MAEATARSLVLLRHGQTDWNLTRRIQGHADAELNDLGHAQAVAVAEQLAALQPGLLWTSDLSRAATTAAYVGKACGLEPVADARLREYSLGPREGLLHSDYAVAHPEEFATFRSGHFDIVPGGEKTPEVEARMTAALRDLLALTPPGSVSVAVSHGAALKVAIASLLGWEVPQARTLGVLDNCGWTLLRESSGEGRLRLAAYNRVASLPDGP